MDENLQTQAEALSEALRLDTLRYPRQLEENP